MKLQKKTSSYIQVADSVQDIFVLSQFCSGASVHMRLSGVQKQCLTAGDYQILDPGEPNMIFENRCS